ncbi:MAG: class I SAM-dependent methyltransferase [Deltaproteobacteria bacterium]|nr:class I SAM-dependent methyltransferase [Deltaproteobacteria bacterium]
MIQNTSKIIDNERFFKKYTSTAMLVDTNEESLTEWSRGYFEKFLLPHLPHDKKSKIIEIGCGYGRYLKALKENGFTELLGIDISEEQVVYAKEKLGLDDIFLADAFSFLEDKTSVYDTIIACDILEHIDLEDSINLLRACFVALKTGGVLLIQVPNAICPISVHTYGDITHKRAYTLSSLRQSLLLSGFSPNFSFFELPPYVHGPISMIRRLLWNFLVKPCIKAYMLIANGDSMGGIYSANLLCVVKK